ncbi:hypothetical protein F2P56_023754 [Juglans regia]|uniref:Uncharacterized protein n=1 Tax=Juglans regia TaxID=51240 RepID=A0A833X987_JUGRE|nr:hypothetical protein F2P56_023754 [Juglans regia]
MSAVSEKVINRFIGKKNWFTPQELVKKYKAANQRAIQALEKYGGTLMEVDIDGSLSYPTPPINSKDTVDKHSRLKPPNIEEKQYMRVFYENKLQKVCNNFHFPYKIQVLFLFSPPQNQCKTIACKIKENHVSAEELGKGISQDHQLIPNNEMIVYQSLEFDLIVYASYRLIDGFVNEMEIS